VVLLIEHIRSLELAPLHLLQVETPDDGRHHPKLRGLLVDVGVGASITREFAVSRGEGLCRMCQHRDLFIRKEIPRTTNGTRRVGNVGSNHLNQRDQFSVLAIVSDPVISRFTQ
jgi:hypothetical protein